MIDCFLNLAELRFATSFPNWLVIGVALLAAVAVMVIYQRESRVLTQPWNWLLPALRGTAVALVMLLIAGPIWHHRQIIGTPGRIVLAVDTSSSMSQTDSQADASGSSTRLDRVVTMLDGTATSPGLIEKFRSTHHLDIVTFDQTARLLWSSRDSSDEENPKIPAVADGLGTRLEQPLQINPSETPEGDDAAGAVMVLLSDGRQTLETSGADEGMTLDPVDAASELAQQGWKVHAVAFGADEEPIDIGVKRVDAPERVADDGRLAGNVNLKAYGVVGRQLLVEIESGGDVVWSKNVDVKTDGELAVEFDFPVAELVAATTARLRGIDHDSVVLPLQARVSAVGTPLSASTVSDVNDSLGFRVAAASRDRRLLILDGSSRWEIRYIRNLFSRDPAWQVDTLLFGPGTDHARVTRGDEPGQLPDTSRTWSRYDAVILGEIPVDQWTAEDAEGLRQFIRRGGGLVVIDGQYGEIARLTASWQEGRTADEDPDTMSVTQKWLTDLIPVRFGSSSKSADTATITDSPVQSSVIEFVSPTTLGGEHPALRLRAEAEDSLELWRELPPPVSITSVTAAPDAEVWAEAQFQGGEKTPWLVTRMVGAGRVFYLATDQTWRWRYKLESQLHGRFWTQLLTAAMQPPYAASDDFVAVGTDRVDYRDGDSAMIRARLLKEDLIPVSENPDDAPELTSLPTVDAIIVRDEQIVATVPLSVDDVARQTFIGQSPPLLPGKYDLRIQASGYDSAALRASTPIWVDAPRTGEWDRVAANRQQLKQITDAGDGETVHESSADALWNRLIASSSGQILESDRLLYQSWWTLAVVILLLTVEWWLRKRVGLL